MRILINKAIIFDDTGRFLYGISFKYGQDILSYQERSYNINTKASYKESKFWFITFRDYYYSINDPNPILLDKRREPIYDARMYNRSLLTKVLTEANNMLKPAWMSLFTAPVVISLIMGFIVILIVIGYYSTGGG